MRTEQEKQAIIETFSEPVSIENFISQEEILELVNEFNNSKEKIHKNTGPITVNIDFTKQPFINLLDKIKTIVGNVEVTAGFFFYTETPHIIHNDDTYELPRVFKGITIPLEYVGGTRYPYLCFFHQYYLEGPAKFFKGGVDFPEHYNKHINNYTDVRNLSDRPIPKVVYDLYIDHLNPEWLEGLSFDRAMPWKPGNVIVFDSVRLHCASNFLKQGIKSKLGISIFTKLNDDVADGK